VETKGDANNCGACGVACRRDQYCNLGTCSCRDNYADCGTFCADKIFDPNNCGGCGVLCSNICNSGSCVPTWAYTDCAAIGSINCGPYAPSGGKACVYPTGDDNDNCGGCGVKCANDQLCIMGACKHYHPAPGGACSNCPSGWTCCTGSVGLLCEEGTTCYS
jgi:hypothetical protein